VERKNAFEAVKEKYLTQEVPQGGSPVQPKKKKKIRDQL